MDPSSPPLLTNTSPTNSQVHEYEDIEIKTARSINPPDGSQSGIVADFVFTWHL